MMKIVGIGREIGKEGIGKEEKRKRVLRMMKTDFLVESMKRPQNFLNTILNIACEIYPCVPCENRCGLSVKTLLLCCI